MVSHYWPIIIGSAVGFIGFLGGVLTMENIIYRKNSTGEKKFSPENLWEYIKLPFDRKAYKTAWGLVPNISLVNRLKLLNLNWIFMIVIGALLGSTLLLF